MSYQLRRNAEYLSRGRGVNVSTAVECIAHRAVARDRREKPQLDLRIVRIDENPAVGRFEISSQLASELAADGNVLHIRIGRGEPPRGGSALIESRVDSRISVCLRRKSLSVGRAQLRYFAVFEHGADNGIVRTKLLKSFGICRISGFGLLPVRQTEILKEHLTELLRRVEVEAEADPFIYCVGERGFMLGELRRKGAQPRGIEHYAVALHFGEHCRKGDLDLMQKLRHSFRLKLFGENRVQLIYQPRIGRGVRQ